MRKRSRGLMSVERQRNNEDRVNEGFVRIQMGIHEMKSQLFYPAPLGVPVPVRPSRGSQELFQSLQTALKIGFGNLKNHDLLRAGAFWLYGFLEESHEIAQGIHSPEGSYWHALMHRSEGDFSNSMYWYSKVGSHRIFPALRNEVEKLSSSGEKSQQLLKTLLSDSEWNPRRLVDLCEQASIGAFTEASVLQQVTALEYNLLMEHVLEK